MHRIPNWMYVVVLGGVLLFPLLGSYGLWDPLEIQLADSSQEMLRGGHWLDLTAGGKVPARPFLSVWLITLGMQIFGVNELAGRLPLALCGFCSLLLTYRFGRRLFNPATGIAAAFVLGTTPAFLFQSRQLISDLPYYLSLLASVGGITSFLWPSSEKRSRFDLVLGALGLIGGFLARGLWLGTIFPLVTLTLAVIFNWRALSGDQTDSNKNTLGQTVIKIWPALSLALGLSLIACSALYFLLGNNHATRSLLLYGAEYRPNLNPPTFETPLRLLGFGFFPWFALLPMMFTYFLLGFSREQTTRSAQTFLQSVVVILAVLSYVLSVLWNNYFTALRFLALPWMAFGVGVLLINIYRGEIAPSRLWALLATILVLVIHQDFINEPQGLAFCHVLDTVKYPAELKIVNALRFFGLLLGIIFFLGLGGAPAACSVDSRGHWWSKIIRLGSTTLDRMGELIRLAGGDKGHRYFWAGASLTLVFAAWCVFYLTPQLSLHLSNKALFETFHHCAGGGERLAQYQVPGRGAAYYNDGSVDEIRDQSQLFELLRQPQRWFILIPATQLGQLNQATREAHVDYYVLDDRNSQYMIISNKLGGTCNQDLNPLRRLVQSTPPNPRKKISANFENKVRLIGYDVDDVVWRTKGKFTITLYFQVLAKVPAGYKIFIHFDQPANRFHGDHDPLEGKLPTQYWLPGDYITDSHEIEIPIMTTPGGSYQILAGFWQGEERLKVIEGPNDNSNRVPLGNFMVR